MALIVHSAYVSTQTIVKNVHLYFRELHTVLQSSSYVHGDNHGHFEGGVKLGVGAFNLVRKMLHVNIVCGPVCWAGRLYRRTFWGVMAIATLCNSKHGPDWYNM